MIERNKKILVIALFIIVSIVIALVLYFLFFRPLIEPTPPVVVPPVTNVNVPTFPPITPPEVYIPPAAVNAPLPTPPTLPPVVTVPPAIGPIVSFEARGGLTSYTTLESATVKNPVLSPDGRNLNYYNADNGFFYNIAPDGTKTVISDISFKNVQNVVWAPNNKKAILEYPDGSNVIYDFNRKSTVTLPTHWEDFTFSPDSNKIAFKAMKLDPEDRYIAISDVNGANYQTIEPLGEENDDVYITWSPNNKYIALFREAIDANRSEIYPIGFYGENFRSFRIEGFDSRYEWSPSGSKLLYSAFNSRSDYNPSLWVVNSTPELLGTGRTKIDLQTWADKCTFATENTLYCAVPQKLDAGSGFFPSFAENTPDDIYKIDIRTGSKEIIAQPLFPTTVERLIVSRDGEYLYILDQTTGELKEIKL